MAKYVWCFLLLSGSLIQGMEKEEEVKVRTAPAPFVTVRKKRVNKNNSNNVTIRRKKAPKNKNLVAPIVEQSVLIVPSEKENSPIKISSPEKQRVVTPVKRVGTPVGKPKSKLPAHIAIAFTEAINNEHYEMALFLRQFLPSYGPATVLNTMIKHPDYVERLASKYHMPSNIHPVKFRSAAAYAISKQKIAAALKPKE